MKILRLPVLFILIIQLIGSSVLSANNTHFNLAPQSDVQSLAAELMEGSVYLANKEKWFIIAFTVAGVFAFLMDIGAMGLLIKNKLGIFPWKNQASGAVYLQHMGDIFRGVWVPYVVYSSLSLFCSKLFNKINFQKIKVFLALISICLTAAGLWWWEAVHMRLKDPEYWIDYLVEMGGLVVFGILSFIEVRLSQKIVKKDVELRNPQVFFKMNAAA